MSEHGPNYNRAKAVVAGAAIIGIPTALLVGQAVENGNKDQQRVDAIHADYENDQAFLADIVKEAQLEADPLDIQDTFQITADNTLIDAGNGIVVNLDGYQDNKDLIDYTILQSALAQGTYHEGETYAVTSAEIDGRETYIVQPIDVPKTLDKAPLQDTQLPDVGPPPDEEA